MLVDRSISPERALGLGRGLGRGGEGELGKGVAPSGNTFKGEGLHSAAHCSPLSLPLPLPLPLSPGAGAWPSDEQGCARLSSLSLSPGSHRSPQRRAPRPRPHEDDPLQEQAQAQAQAKADPAPASLMTMAETQVDASGSGGGGGGGGAGPPPPLPLLPLPLPLPLLHHHHHHPTANNNNNNLPNNNHHRSSKQRKRKRLSQVVDKLATQVSSSPSPLPLPLPLNNNFHLHNNNHHKELSLLKHVKSEPEDEEATQGPPPPPAPALRPKIEPSTPGVFRFDGPERYSAISEEDETEDVFSPASSSKSPHSSTTDSPKISFSPLRLKDSSVEEEGQARPLQDRFFPASPVSPLTPASPAPAPAPAPIYHFEHYLHNKYLPDIFRRRSHSDSDLPLWFEAAKVEPGEAAAARTSPKQPPQPLTLPSAAKGGSQGSEASTPQDSPLDLSMKGSRERVGSSTSSESAAPPTPATPASLEAAPPPPPPPQPPLQLQLLTPGFLPPGKGHGAAMAVPVVKGDVASPTTKESVAVRYNLEVSPVVEEMPPGSDVAYVCPVCGQMFSLHDRLAKHMASRHKSRAAPDAASKAYLCDICKRSFARSDMLTRHMRLHTGVKPYTCRICGQVFSRSDHLSTHQRTHTGEKPYRCPQCPYAACRRDMITRHMRTHARGEPGAERPERGRGRGRRGGRGRGRGRGGGVNAGAAAAPEFPPPEYPDADAHLPPECISPQSPLSPSQALSSLSVLSPAAQSMDADGHEGD